VIEIRGKTCVVVGGAGFVGQSLVKLLVSLEARVYVLDNYSRDKGKTRRVAGARYSSGDVGDDATHLSTCKQYFRVADFVFNLAAHVAGVSYNVGHQLEMLTENLTLQTVPVMAAQAVGVRNFLQVSSVCVYSPTVQTGTPVKEEDGEVGPVQEANKGYDIAKRCGEVAALVSGIENVVVVRPSNVAGAGDYYDDRAHVIPALVARAVESESLDVYSSPEIVREFIHPFDVASGMIRAIIADRTGEVYNIGNSANVIQLGDLVYMIQAATGTESRPVIFHNDSVSGDPYRASDSNKLMKLGWSPKFDMKKIVADEVNGYMLQRGGE